MPRTANDIATHAVYGSAADTAQALSETYAALAAIALTPQIRSIWTLAAEIAGDVALKARTRAHGG